MSEPASPNPPDKPPKLDYRAPEQRPVAATWQVVAGCILTTPILLILYYVSGVVAVVGNNAWVAALVPLGLAAASAMVGVRSRRRGRAKGVGFGILLGTGLACLIYGTCWAMIIGRGL